MFRSFLIVFVLALGAWNASACPPSDYRVGNVRLTAEGIVTRVVHVCQAMDSQTGNVERKYVPIVRDRIELEVGDVITLNTEPTMVDAMIQLEVRAHAQERDEKGIFSTTYLVKQIETPLFGGPTQKAIEKSSFITIKSNYMGNGTYSKGCGGIEKADVDTVNSAPSFSRL